MTLGEAYNVGKKYGFTFNGIGPSLSLVNNKIGICLNILDYKYGYLKRNFTFDKIGDLDIFLKKYSFYIRNKDKEKFYLYLNDYKIDNPIIQYSFDEVREKKEKIELNNKTLLLEEIKIFLDNFYLEFDKLLNEIKDKILIEQDYYSKYNYYKKLLYQTYNQTIDDNIIKVDDSIKAQIAKQFEDFKKAQKIFLDINYWEKANISDLENWYCLLVSKCREAITDDNIINVLYEKVKFEENARVLNQMIEYLLNNTEANENVKDALQSIKDTTKPFDSYENFANKYRKKIENKYSTLDSNNILSYCSNLFGTKKIEYVVYEEPKIFISNVIDLNPIYNNLSEKSKRALTLFYSPLKPILIYIIEQAYKRNTSFNFQTREFKNIYYELVTCLDNGENLVFKLKYFKDVKISSYDDFIKSLVKVAKTVCSSYLEIPFDLKLYSLNFGDCLITGSDKIIQDGDDIVNIIDAQKNTYVIYSPVKINVNSKNNTFVLKENRNVVYLPNYNNDYETDNSVTEVSIYEEGYDVMNVAGDNLLIVTGFTLKGIVSFNEVLMYERHKNDK
ncbi:MAG: hypothetical protein IJO33_01185 [Bacilli bacterium]|nr:hypothetical protein [Bacilli bacterium]